MNKFLSDQRVTVFVGAVLTAVGGWIITATRWVDLLTPAAIGGLFAILGSVLLSNVTSNVFRKPPLITETTTPSSTTTVTTVTPPQDK